MHDFRKLLVWQKSMSLVKEVFVAVNKFPKEEVFGLTSQIKRSVVSIPSNIAEGCGRGTDKQLKYHLEVALGSAFELETQLQIGSDLNYLNKNEAQDLISKTQEISKMISGLKKSLKV